MLAVMKKDMSSSLHSNADLSRSHACLQAALKLRDRPTSLSALADLASHVSTMLLMLPLPAKSDTGMTAAGLQCSSGQPRPHPTCVARCYADCTCCCIPGCVSICNCLWAPVRLCSLPAAVSAFTPGCSSASMHDDIERGAMLCAKAPI